MTDARKTMALALDALHAMENAMLDRGVHTDPEHPYRQALNFACTARNALRAALEQQAEPVQYEMRMRPTWEANSWSDWQKCSKESAGDYIKTPKLHDWLYEVRAIYTSPTQRKPLSEDMVHRAMLALNTASCGELEPTFEEMKSALEAAHGKKGEA